MEAQDLTVAIGLSQGYRHLLRICLSTIPADVRKVISWYGPGDPDDLPPNATLVRPQRHADNFQAAYVLNVALRAVQTPYVLLADADFAFPRFFFQVLEPAPERVVRFFAGRLTPQATERVLAGTAWEDLYADYQGLHQQLYRVIYGANNPCLYPTKVLLQTRGYDERFIGWGAHDDELTWRTRRLGLRDVRAPIIVAVLDDGHIADYAEYRRGTTSPANRRLFRISRQVVVNPAGWGDKEP
jgi:hypothetical protein